MSRTDHERWEEAAAAVSHELATPLTVARAALEALLDASDDRHVRELAETAARSLRSVELQVGRLRRLETATSEDLVRRQVDVVALIRELVDDLRATVLHAHPSEVEAPASFELPVDSDQLRQVLYNLLSNAAKYSPAGREIVVSLERVGDEAVLQVRDRGEGVAPDDAERIFEKYERAGRAGPGAGLGLFLARLVVEAHGGTLRLVPAEGEGSIFEVRLPVEAA